MKRRSRRRFHIGLRTLKTALAVTLALLLARLLGATSSIFAGLGAISAVTRALRDSLREAKTQFVGVILGGAVGILLLLVDPQPAEVLVGAGVLAVISLCNLLGLFYAVSLSAAIVLSVCVSTDGNVLAAMAYRLLDTSIGLLVGLGVNMFLKPYSNRHQVVSLLLELADSVPDYLDRCVIQNLYPDLSDLAAALRELDLELDVYRRQYFRAPERHKLDVAFLEGAAQLAGCIHQELTALCCLDSIGVPLAGNQARLQDLGLCVAGLSSRVSTEEADIVTNYHLGRVLDARAYLLELLDGKPEA